MDKLLGEYLDYLEIEKNRSVKTRENYERYLARFLNWAKVSSPGEIDDESVRKYRLWLNRQNLKKQTQNYYVIALRGFLKYLAKRGVKTLPAERIELARSPSRDIEVLEADEVERLLSSPNVGSLQGKRDRALLEILFSTGLRVSELCSLNRDSVNLSRDEFSVRGKGDKVRVVFLSGPAKKALADYLDSRGDIDEALFIHIPRGKTFRQAQGTMRLTPRSVQRMVKKHAVGAGITKDVHPHVLRHSFATDLLRNGADLRSVQALLGHSSITTTQIYTHLTDTHLHEVHKAFHARRRNKA